SGGHGTPLASHLCMFRFKPRIDWILTLLLCAAGGASAQAPVNHPLEDLRQVAEAFVVAQVPAGAGTVHASADAVDPRLRLPRCAQQPAAQLPASTQVSARVPVGVSCANPRWTIYVPVRVETELPVLVLQRSLSRNAKVTIEDVEVRTL